MSTKSQLTQVFNDNFTTYFRSHVAHVNIMGRNFTSDHSLLGEIYEDLQDQIDTIGELLRSINEFMPSDLMTVLTDSHIPSFAMEGSSETLLGEVRTDLEHLKGCYEMLMETAEEEEHDEIANYAQERILAIAKFIWKLNATLD
jgi:DNA-binding ferritin-like protein